MTFPRQSAALQEEHRHHHESSPSPEIIIDATDEQHDDAQRSTHILYPLHLVLFTLLHASYAFILLLHSTFTFTSPRQTHQEALAIGRAVVEASSDDPAAAEQTPSRRIKIPSHLALILQTPHIPHFESEDEAREAEWRAAEFLREEVGKVAHWCDQLRVGQLSVMDTAGLLARVGLVPAAGSADAGAAAAEDEKRMERPAVEGAAAELPNGHAAAEHPSGGHADAAQLEQQHMRKRPRSRLRSTTGNDTEDAPGTPTSSAGPGDASDAARASCAGRSSVIDRFDLADLPIRILSPDDGEQLFARAADRFRAELDHKLDRALGGSRAQTELRQRTRRHRRRRGDSGDQVTKGERFDGSDDDGDDDGWTQVHARDSSGSSREGQRKDVSSLANGNRDAQGASDLEAVRTEMLEWIDSITVGRMDEALQDEGYVPEPDFLILHGVPKRAMQLYGFPAWAVRLTEIFQDSESDPRRPISLATFVRAIKYFNRTEQRFGK